ncbi:hypothetical protein [Glutamicibacter sp. NPDC087583]|uniref:Gp37-like protein n=1 Tax=Glutamicibacter sp. NPDC087583 TaxID=3363995 RepID=UPI0037FD8D90
MIPEDVTFEVRDRTYARLGSIEPAAILDALIQPELNDAGSWSLKIPAGHALASALRQPGAGIIVSIDGAEVFSGPTTAPRHKQGLSQSPIIQVEGVSDNIVVLEELAYPNPDSAAGSHQIAETDTRTGTPGQVLTGFINANVGSAAPTARRRGSMVAINESTRSNTLTKRGRFQDLGELAVEICNPNSMGFNVIQEGTRLVARVFDLRNRSGLVRFSIENGQLQAIETGKTAPTLTRVLVAGQGEAENRRIVEVTTPASLAAESQWGVRRATFIDQPSEQDESVLRQAGEDALASAGGGATEIVSKAIPSDEASKRYGSAWRVGDQVTLETGAGEEAALITGAAIKVGPAGVQVGAVTGPLRRWDREKAALMEKVNRRSSSAGSGGGGGSGGSASLEFGTIGPEPIFGANGLVRLVKEGTTTPTGHDYQWMRDYSPAVNDRVGYLGNTILGRAIGAPYDNGQWTEPAPPTGRLPDADPKRWGELRFTKLSSGAVFANGAIYNNTGTQLLAGAHLFTMPADFRPVQEIILKSTSKDMPVGFTVSEATGAVTLGGSLMPGAVMTINFAYNASNDIYETITSFNRSAGAGEDAFGFVWLSGSHYARSASLSLPTPPPGRSAKSLISGSSGSPSGTVGINGVLSLLPGHYDSVSYYFGLAKYPTAAVTGWQALPLTNGFQIDEGDTPEIMLRPDGAAALRGSVINGLTPNLLVLTVPEGMRPKYEVPLIGGYLLPNGQVRATGSSMTFYTEMWIADH